MGYDDFNINNDDPVFGWDYIDYMNKTGIYDESHDEEDPEGELMMFGLNPDELECMSDEARREALEDVGLDPNDYDFDISGVSGGNNRIYRSNASTRRSTYTKNTTNISRKTSSGKWSLLEFTIVMTIISIIGYAIAAVGGELLGAIVVIIIGIIILSCF